ncbi:superoxide dismutase 1 copper chaperone (heavy-metal-associated domain-containing protein) [Colletotrichum tofieldiae]|uniref:Superoxide dismutase 1 copper chaperone n=1 Tax=Colletotrichum tofieldiae TaxID=708197 RepID=A0A166MA39_9PEZI|nr:superoxide dismutase 1 copper chaperone (heavy-metal-associated domain-containing protein) [Colletotrichum tofieldiae]
MLYCLPDFLHNHHSLLRSPLQPSRRPFMMTVSYPFQTVFAVPMTCDSCVKDVSDSLYKLGGITKVEANLEDQLLSVEGTAAPSAIVDAIQATGRDTILRGSGGSNSAAVSILESFYRADDAQHASKKLDEESDREVRGLARMVQVSPTTTLIDLTLRGVAPGSYRATIREYGNLAEGASSTGPVWSGGGEGNAAKGFLGVFHVGKDGRGSAYLDKPFQIWEVIGHAMVVSRQDESAGALKNDLDTVVGVIARSAGVWDNDKTVCSCTGKTLWEERKDEVKKGML